MTDVSATRRPGPPLRLIVPVGIFAALAVLFAFALSKGDPSKLPSALIGKPAPLVALPPIPELVDDQNRPMPGFETAKLVKGQPAVVNFWASWCVPCVQEHPFLVDLPKRTGVAVHGINYKDQPVAARRFLGRYGNPFLSVGQDSNGRAAIEWGVYGMPETFVLDGQGTIVYKHVGPITKEIYEQRLVPAILQAKTSAGPS